jgi:hypothetical protein
MAKKKKSGPKGPRKGPISEKEINIFEELCKIQCTLNELASAFSCTRDTIIKRIEEHYKEDFSTIFKQKKEGGQVSLRRSQWNKAVTDKNTTMLIFLGKQYLGQSDFGTDDDIKAMLYRTRIGPDGAILNEIKNRTEWEADKNFDAKAMLTEDNKDELKTKKKIKGKTE